MSAWGDYNEIPPSLGWDPDVAYFAAKPLNSIRQRGRLRIAMSVKPEQVKAARPKLSADLTVEPRDVVLTPGQEARRAVVDYRRATGWWAKGGAA